MEWLEPDLKKDNLLWEDIITIDVNENISHFKHREYSSHIVRLYENCNKEKYYLFIQPTSSFTYENWERKNEWQEPTSTFASWGKSIMQYNEPQYRSLRKIIKFDDDTTFFGVLGGADLNSLKDNILKKDIIPIWEGYRQPR